MSRFNPYSPNAHLTFEAIDHWKKNCLSKSGSVFSDEGTLWTGENFSGVINERLIESIALENFKKRNFIFILKQKLEGADPLIYKLVAEVLWVLYLAISDVRVETRKQKIREIWELSGSQFPNNHKLLKDEYMEGVGHGGQGFVRLEWMEMRTLLLFMQTWKKLNSEKQYQLLNDHKEFSREWENWWKQWMERFPYAEHNIKYKNRQIRNILVHLLFPDYFERILPGSQKFKIVSKVKGKIFARKATWAEMDETLLEIRQEQEKQYGTKKLDYFNSPKDPLWLLWNPPTEIKEEGKLYSGITKNSDTPLNQIFFGPPGTGKTYRTIDIALKIIDPNFYKNHSHDRNELRSRFEELMGKQIEFVTFHQSFGYEEFVEGIRPIMGEEEGNVSYKIKEGVFKDIAKRAEENLKASQREEYDFDIDNLISRFAEDVRGRMEENEEEIYLFKGKYEDISTSKTKIREVKIESSGDFRHIRIGTDGGVNQFLDAKIIKKYYPEFRKGKIKKSKDIPPTKPSLVSWHGNHLYYFGILKHISDFEKKENKNSSDVGPVPLKKYVLVIDEINRGNISRIFGELITLIEDTKRLGEQEEMSARLPYSEEPFGVPNNLYIIGTMNTADRSIALLDTALRRRFRFEEMMPDIKKLRGIEINDIDVASMLEAINRNIEVEYDRDHQIGHSYFMRLKDNPSLATLEEIFRHEILPLLQEYFHDDWEKIDLVLKNNGFLMGEKIRNRDKTLWKINPDPFKVESYKKIYKRIEEEDDE